MFTFYLELVDAFLTPDRQHVSDFAMIQFHKKNVELMIPEAAGVLTIHMLGCSRCQRRNEKIRKLVLEDPVTSLSDQFRKRSRSVTLSISRS